MVVTLDHRRSDRVDFLAGDLDSNQDRRSQSCCSTVELSPTRCPGKNLERKDSATILGSLLAGAGHGFTRSKSSKLAFGPAPKVLHVNDIVEW